MLMYSCQVVERDLSRSLHALTGRLDRAADAILRAEAGLSYSRFLALFMVRSLGADTQRALAERLGVSEPSVSRMTRVLSEEGLLRAGADPAGGNRRQLTLTATGEQLVERWGGELEKRFAVLVEDAGVPYRTYAEYTRRLLEQLDGPESTSRRRARR
jgi:DNA-binding MarR family transcriptional regulator